jgi:hypothetical protein
LRVTIEMDLLQARPVTSDRLAVVGEVRVRIVQAAAKAAAV